MKLTFGTFNNIIVTMAISREQDQVCLSRNLYCSQLQLFSVCAMAEGKASINHDEDLLQQPPYNCHLSPSVPLPLPLSLFALPRSNHKLDTALSQMKGTHLAAVPQGMVSTG